MKKFAILKTIMQKTISAKITVINPTGNFHQVGSPPYLMRRRIVVRYVIGIKNVINNPTKTLSNVFIFFNFFKLIK